MRLIKYNISKGTKASNSNTATSYQAVSNSTVDLSSVYSRLNDDEATIGELNRQVT